MYAASSSVRTHARVPLCAGNGRIRSCHNSVSATLWGWEACLFSRSSAKGEGVSNGNRPDAARPPRAPRLHRGQDGPGRAWPASVSGLFTERGPPWPSPQTAGTRSPAPPRSLNAVPERPRSRASEARWIKLQTERSHKKVNISNKSENTLCCQLRRAPGPSADRRRDASRPYAVSIHRGPIDRRTANQKTAEVTRRHQHLRSARDRERLPFAHAAEGRQMTISLAQVQAPLQPAMAASVAAAHAQGRCRRAR